MLHYHTQPGAPGKPNNQERRPTIMAKFSKILSAARKTFIRAPDTVNHAGGAAYAQPAKLELVSTLVTSFLQDEFYRTEPQTVARIRELIAMLVATDPLFVAKAALYARHQHGMRSVSHLVAGEIARHVKGASWSKNFHDKIVRRPDDAIEILGYYLAAHGRPLPNSLKKGLGAALARFDEYQLAKYRRDHAAFKLVDAVNLVRPPATPAINALMRGRLAPATTWETRLTQAGAAAAAESPDNAEALAAAKADAWGSLVRERKLGYLALLRNARNILEHAPDAVGELCGQLADETAVRRSLVYPFQFLTALDALRKGNLAGTDRVMDALNQAVDHSLANVPRFEGATLVALDCSGSMAGHPQAIGSLFAAVLVKASGADLMLFSDDAQYHALNRRDTTLTAAKSIPFAAGGTDFNAIFQCANRAYDRVIVLSDMQGWIGGGAPLAALADYERAHNASPRIFSFDLNGYGTLQFPRERVYCLAGWSDRVFEIMQKLDHDPRALVREVEAVELG
ncbi:hypothetical protein CKA38_06430 [Ereboglobus luteus]|uniref:TROVE domain-containing protein n=2 Tax=Ereboglobus luteus TaxID=1796921 RepID=A0A2U8E2K8_9BACT|nr:hypothetical protein CKA38_06430 [Ereboglobus luteus]